MTALTVDFLYQKYETIITGEKVGIHIFKPTESIMRFTVPNLANDSVGASVKQIANYGQTLLSTPPYNNDAYTISVEFTAAELAAVENEEIVLITLHDKSRLSYVEELDWSSSYFIDSIIGSDYNSGRTPDSAWRTISKLSSVTLVPGNKVLFKRGGTWAEQLTIPSSGTSGNPITFGAYGSGAKPIISIETPIKGTDIDYITIQDLELSGWADYGIHNIGGDGWVIQRNDISGGDDVDPMSAIFIDGNTADIAGVTIDSNNIGPIGTYAAATAAIANHFIAIRVDDADDAVVSNNKIHEVNALGIRSQGDVGDSSLRAIITGNEIYEGYIGGIQFQYSDNGIVRRNHIHDGTAWGVAFQASDGGTIAYNLIHNSLGVNANQWHGIDITSGSTDGFIYNNTVYAVRTDCQTLEETGGASTGWTVKNNIYDASANTSQRGGGERYPFTVFDLILDGEWTDKYNLHQDYAVGDSNTKVAMRYNTAGGIITDYTLAAWKVLGYGEFSKNGDPLFTDPANGDFSLQTGSPAIAAGVNVGETKDLNGNQVLDPPSMGAIEVVS